MDAEHRKLVRDAVLDEMSFVKATFSGRRTRPSVPWERVTLRPVRLKAGPRIQFAYFDGQQEVVENLPWDEAPQALDRVLGMPFRSIRVDTAEDAFRLQITRRGRSILHRRAQRCAHSRPSVAHDRRKDLPLPVGEPDQLLERMGIADSSGRVRPGMRRKFRQVNEFLRLVLETGRLSETDQPEISIVDCGCGSALLTFAIYHYLNHKLTVPARVVGVDVKEDLLARLDEQVDGWGWEGLRFEVARILDFSPPTRPDVVLALHACDTATDEALAQAVRWRATSIFCVPCCHHHLQQQLPLSAIPADLHAVARHGILRERLGDLMTDALRAQILRMVGYRADVVEFVSPEHTAKNLMIRAVRIGSVGPPEARSEYRALIDRWQIQPFLADLLSEELAEAGI